MTREVPEPLSRHFLRTFGSPALLETVGEEQRVVELRRKDLALLVFLAVEGERRHHRSTLASMLWGDSSEDKGRHSLTQALGRIRSLVGPGAAVLSHEAVEWRAHLASDAAELTTALGTDPDVAHPSLPGPFLAEFSAGRGAAEFELWVEEKRAYYRVAMLQLLDRLGEAAERRGAWGEALELGRRSVEVDPIFEEGHRRVMRAWTALGERGLAYQHYRNFSRWLDAELEVEPDPSTQALAEQMRESEAVREESASRWVKRWSAPSVQVGKMVFSGRPGGGAGAEENEDAEGGELPQRGLQILRLFSRRSVRVATAFVMSMAVVATAAFLLPKRWLGAVEVETLPGSGQPFTTVGSSDVYLPMDGIRWTYPDWATLLACTSWQSGLVKRLSREPNMPRARRLPSVLENPWMAGFALVKSDASDTVYAMVGCVKSVVPPDQVRRHARAGGVQIVPADMLAAVPTGPEVRATIRPAGTLIRSLNGSEIRWVVFAGGALAVSSPRVLSSHCRTTVLEVDPAEFEAYFVVGNLQSSQSACGSARPNVGQGKDSNP